MKTDCFECGLGNECTCTDSPIIYANGRPRNRKEATPKMLVFLYDGLSKLKKENDDERNDNP